MVATSDGNGSRRCVTPHGLAGQRLGSGFALGGNSRSNAETRARPGGQVGLIIAIWAQCIGIPGFLEYNCREKHQSTIGFRTFRERGMARGAFTTQGEVGVVSSPGLVKRQSGRFVLIAWCI